MLGVNNKSGWLGTWGSLYAPCTGVPSQDATKPGRLKSTSLWIRGLNITGNLSTEALAQTGLSKRLEERDTLSDRPPPQAPSQKWHSQLILHLCLHSFHQHFLLKPALLPQVQILPPPSPLNYSSWASLSDSHSLEHEGEMTPRLRIHQVCRVQGFSRKLHLIAPQGLGVTAPQLCLSCWPKRQPRQEVGSLRRPGSRKQHYRDCWAYAQYAVRTQKWGHGLPR